MKFLSTEYCTRLISNRRDCVGHLREKGHVPLDAHVPLVRDDPLGEIRSNCGEIRSIDAKERYLVAYLIQN